MSTATAVEAAVPAKPGKKKKFLIILLVTLLLLAVAGGAALFLMKKKAAAEEEADSDGDGTTQSQAHGPVVRDPKVVPVFVPLDTFTVNLADRETDRYAQIGISLELDDSNTGDRIKLFMPAIRNNILMVLAHKRSSDLLERSGKEQLAAEVLRETERALGIEPAVAGAKPAEDTPHPVRAVHFSNFIIQ
jgi:flagellar FliL protein